MCCVRAKIMVARKLDREQKRESSRERVGQRGNELTREEIGRSFSESWGLPATIPSLPHPISAVFPFFA